MLAELGQPSPVIDGIRCLAGKLTGRKPAVAQPKSFLSLFAGKKRA
jgi:hypothetical protein